MSCCQRYAAIGLVSNHKKSCCAAALASSFHLGLHLSLSSAQLIYVERYKCMRRADVLSFTILGTANQRNNAIMSASASAHINMHNNMKKWQRRRQFMTERRPWIRCVLFNLFVCLLDSVLVSPIYLRSICCPFRTNCIYVCAVCIGER